MQSHEFDVIVVGAGAAGISAALAAARSGARTALLEANPYAGGELVSGLPVDSCVNARGEWVVGGTARRLFESVADLGGYIGPVFDWRTMHAVCVDPEIMKLAVVRELAAAGVTVRLQTVVEGVLATGDGSIRGVSTVGRGGRSVYLAAQLIDCSGDAWLPVKAGAQTVAADESELQPVSLVYRIGPVDFERYLAFVRDNPGEFLLGENPAIGLTPAECARRAYDSGMPHVALSCDGPLLGGAIASGEMYPCTFVFTWPTSLARREVGLNTTRVAGIDATDDAHLSDVFADLAEQVVQGLAFCQKHLPGFDNAGLTGLASRVGVRETRRILGEYTLTADDVISGRKRDDGVAKGSHHVDIHGRGTAQLRIPVQDGGSYDVPFGTLIPVGLRNLLVAGRCLSSSREANGSARVMGTCLGTGQAAGVAAAMAVQRGISDLRDLPVDDLRQSLREMGAVLDGTR